MKVYALTGKGKAMCEEMRRNPGLAKTSSYQVLQYLSRTGAARADQIAGGTGLSAGEVVSRLDEFKSGHLVRILANV